MVSSRFRTALALSLLLAYLLAIPGHALAWGKAGHRVVATLATSLLTPEARTRVADLLGLGVTLAEVATWADDVRRSRPNTANWHYVNIPRDTTGFDATRDCRRGKIADET